MLQRRYGGAPIPARLAWTAWGVYLLAPVILVQNLFRRDVNWRGRVYVLDGAAALAAGTATATATARPALSGLTLARSNPSFVDELTFDDDVTGEWPLEDSMPSLSEHRAA
jgi:hypothetical protein